MTLGGLIDILAANPGLAILVALPNGSFVPAHFHVTEVGRVQKDFIDCGGTIRSSISCLLQLWIASDLSHRLDTTKLAMIISKGAELFESTEVPLEVEYESGVVSQYPVLDFAIDPTGLILRLGTKHTACLAPDRCGVQLDVLASCSTPDCC